MNWSAGMRPTATPASSRAHDGHTPTPPRHFSETIDDGDFAYADNPNVIFEAGMLHALINSPDAPPSGWIPVREKDAPPAPFDFANERIELVPRDERGKIEEDQFRRRIRRRVDDLLSMA